VLVAQGGDAVVPRARGLCCGFDFGAPAAEVYQPPLPFTRTIGQVAVELAGELIADGKAALRKIVAQQ
jgi:hypothetical protein